MTRLALVGVVLAAAGVCAAGAGADGLPVEGVDASRTGVTVPGGGSRYVTLPVHRGTVVVAVERNGGRVLATRFLSGRFTVPAVAYDGSAAGLSADGSTLVLIKPRARFPRRETALAALEAGSLRVREIVHLRGDFSFDALSPRGTWLYLVQYLSPRDPTRYLVRLYDLRTGELAPEPVIDPREVGVMRGTPITRASSPDGRWAYTLYDGAGEHPFIHALDTVGRSARCIDLHGLMGYPGLPDVRLDVGPGGGTISVRDGEQPLALVDTKTFEVAEPAAPKPGPPAKPMKSVPAAPADDREGFPWFPVSLGCLIALLALTGLERGAKVRLGRRPPQPGEVLGGIGDEVEVELRDPLLDDSPHGLPEVGHEAHEAERPRVPVP
jgi:hypothetical protein